MEISIGKDNISNSAPEKNTIITEGNKNIYDYEIIEDTSTLKYSIYFIESHNKNLDHEITIQYNKSLKYITNFCTIFQIEKEFQSQEFIISIYKIEFMPELIPKKEIKFPKLSDKVIDFMIYLKHNKSKYESKHTINIGKNNFLGELKFKAIQGWIWGEYKPPEIYPIVDSDIVILFNDILLSKENKNEKDSVYLDFIEYGVKLLFKHTNALFKFEFFLIIYSNIILDINNTRIISLFDIFNINNIMKQDNYSELLKYYDKMEYIYKNQDKIIFVYQQNIVKYYSNQENKRNLEDFLIKFYTIYTYFLFLSKKDKKLEEFLLELKENKYDN